MTYRITTDSTADMPWSFYKEREIACIGLGFHLGDKEYKESPDMPITPSQFYNHLREGGRASTMQVNAYEFIEFVEPFLKAGEDVLHIAFSSGLSGTYASCMTAAEELREKYPERQLIVIDSLAASMGEGLLVYYADENRRNGLSIEENAAWLMENRLHLCHWFTVDDLMHLHRGGRVSKASAIFGSLLGIKPVLHVDDEGHLILVSKARGREAALEALVSRMAKTALNNVKDQMIFISHGDAQKDAEKVARLVEEKTGAKTFMIHSIGAVIGSHSGPGTIALFFLGSKR